MIKKYDNQGRVIYTYDCHEDGFLVEKTFGYNDEGEQVLLTQYEEIIPFDEEDYYEEK